MHGNTALLDTEYIFGKVVVLWYQPCSHQWGEIPLIWQMKTWGSQWQCLHTWQCHHFPSFTKMPGCFTCSISFRVPWESCYYPHFTPRETGLEKLLNFLKDTVVLGPKPCLAGGLVEVSAQAGFTGMGPAQSHRAPCFEDTRTRWSSDVAFLAFFNNFCASIPILIFPWALQPL